MKRKRVKYVKSFKAAIYINTFISRRQQTLKPNLHNLLCNSRIRQKAEDSRPDRPGTDTDHLGRGQSSAVLGTSRLTHATLFLTVLETFWATQPTSHVVYRFQKPDHMTCHGDNNVCHQHSRLPGKERAWYSTTHYARRYMSNGMIHVQRSFREIACALNKFIFVESWFLDTRSSGRRYIAWRKTFPLTRIQDTGCLLAPDWSKIVPLCDVSAATGPCIQKSTFNQSELNARAISRNVRWTCIIPLDMYCLA